MKKNIYKLCLLGFILSIILSCSNKDEKRLTGTWNIKNAVISMKDSPQVASKTIDALGTFIFTNISSDAPDNFLYKDGTWTFNNFPFNSVANSGDLMWGTQTNKEFNGNSSWDLWIAFGRHIIPNNIGSGNVDGYNGSFKVTEITKNKKYKCSGNLFYYKIDSLPALQLNFELEK